MKADQFVPQKMNSDEKVDRYNDDFEDGGITSITKEMFELEMKRKAKDREIEHEHKLRENAVKILAEKFKRSEHIKPKDNINAKKDYDSECKLLYKLMNEYEQSKNEAIPENVDSSKIGEDIGSNKDNNEPEPKRESTRNLKSGIEIPKQVSNPVETPDVEKSRNDKKAKSDIEKRSAYRSNGEDEIKEREERPTRLQRKVVYKEYSSDEDKGVDERVEIEKCSAFGTCVMKKSKSKGRESDIENILSRRTRRVDYKEYSNDEDEGIGKNICAACRSREAILKELGDKDEKEETVKSLSRKIMKKPRNENAETNMERCSSRLLKKVSYKEYSNEDDEDVGVEKCSARQSRKSIMEELGDKDEREEFKKHSYRKVRNVVAKNSKEKKDSEIKKRSSRQPTDVIYKEYSSDDDEGENVDVRIKKHPSSESTKTVLIISSDEDCDENMETETCSSRRSKGVKYKELRDEDAGIEKLSFHGSRNVHLPKESSQKIEMPPAKRVAREYREEVTKRPRIEDVEEGIQRLRNFLLKRSRGETEDREARGLTSFSVVESSVHPKKIEKIDDNEGLSENYIMFRRRVLEVISKPYDKSEYKALLEEFFQRCYPIYHEDLVVILERNRSNPRKSLAILRGFFFWLQNMRREESFQPWHDDVCLNVELPPPGRGGN